MEKNNKCKCLKIKTKEYEYTFKENEKEAYYDTVERLIGYDIEFRTSSCSCREERCLDFWETYKNIDQIINLQKLNKQKKLS